MSRERQTRFCGSENVQRSKRDASSADSTSRLPLAVLCARVESARKRVAARVRVMEARILREEGGERSEN